MSLAINIPNKNLEATQVRSEYMDESFRIILTLLNNINSDKESDEQVKNTSIIDIDVIQIGNNLNDANFSALLITYDFNFSFVAPT